ncbi:MAG: ABC transporter substrate-binding protein [Armatimonadetes bacterium]|nr:ABC transporter substrate-binding protein [Armatimonadota bacterium]
MFCAIARRRIDLEGLEFEHVLQDIQTLNEWAFEGRLEVTAVSLHAYAHLADRYALLASGASLGHGYGPILVVRPGTTREEALAGPVAIPGKLTTAYLAAQLHAGRFPIVEVPFDQILEVVRAGGASAGLVIHEGQLTYRSEGLELLEDLGKWWEQETGGLPLPLGVNVVRRDLGEDTIQRLARILERSIRYGLANHDEAVEYAMQFGRGLDRALCDRFVAMYVNETTLDFGERGRAGVRELLGRAHRAGWIPQAVEVEFVKAAEGV